MTEIQGPLQYKQFTEMDKRNIENLVWTYQDELKLISEEQESVGVIPFGPRKTMYETGIIKHDYLEGRVVLPELGKMLLEASYEAEREESLFEFAGLEGQMVQDEEALRSDAPAEDPPVDEDPEESESESSETEASQQEEAPQKRAPRPKSVADKIPRDKLEQLIEQGLTAKKIAKELEVSTESVRRYAKKYDLKLSRGHTPRETQSVDPDHQVLTEPLIDPCSLKLEELIERYSTYTELYTSYGQEIQRRRSLLQEVA